VLRLGLDLGTNSIGWVLYRLKDADSPEPIEIVDGGVSIHSDGRNPKNRASNAADRRMKRGPRRNRDRTLRRRRRVAAQLRICGLLPDPAEDRAPWRQLDPLKLRAEALDRPLSRFELGRVLLSFAERRGFKSNRQADGGEEGWWVPDYVVEQNPELTTLQEVIKRPDLFPDKEEPGKGRFYGCPPGWACEYVNANLFKAYGLDDAGLTIFNPGSGEGLAGAIASAYERGNPIFAYYWAPTALLGNYPMVKLGGMVHDPETWPCIIDKDCADPQPNMYAKSVVLTVVTASFAESAPDAFGFVSSVSWPNNLVNSVLAWKDSNQATTREAAEYFLKNHEDVWTAWVSEDVAAKVKAAMM